MHGIIPLLFYVKSNFMISPCQASFHSGQSTFDQIFFLSPFQMAFRNPSLALTLFLQLSTVTRLSALSGIPLSFASIFRLASLFALFDGLNFFF